MKIKEFKAMNIKALVEMAGRVSVEALWDAIKKEVGRGEFFDFFPKNQAEELQEVGEVSGKATYDVPDGALVSIARKPVLIELRNSLIKEAKELLNGSGGFFSLGYDAGSSGKMKVTARVFILK